MRDISSFTDFPEVLEGRVKTLHPRVHGGLLYKRGNELHEKQAKEQGFQPIDLVVVNLYPFEATIQKPDVTLAEAIDQIDIGGPSMIRSAAKNYESVTVVVDPADYDSILEDIRDHEGGTSLKLRERLAIKAFILTSDYDRVISNFLNREQATDASFSLANALALAAAGVAAIHWRHGQSGCAAQCGVHLLPGGGDGGVTYFAKTNVLVRDRLAVEHDGERRSACRRWRAVSKPTASDCRQLAVHLGQEEEGEIRRLARRHHALSRRHAVGNADRAGLERLYDHRHGHRRAAGEEAFDDRRRPAAAAARCAHRDAAECHSRLELHGPS